MKQQYIDTNVFLRSLLKDHPTQSPASFNLLQQAQHNQVELVTSGTVIEEIVYVLSSTRTYNVPRLDIRKRLLPLLKLPGLKFAQRNLYLRALDLFVQQNIDFADCVSVAFMEQQSLDEVYSYDKHFDRFEQLARLEPKLQDVENNTSKFLG